MNLEFEAERVAVCFGFSKWNVIHLYEAQTVYANHWGEVEWEMFNDGRLRFIRTYGTHFFRSSDSGNIFECRVWEQDHAHQFRQLFARGLYRLGFEEESLVAPLAAPLTAHEQLELRLSLPREFWPPSWGDEIN